MISRFIKSLIETRDSVHALIKWYRSLYYQMPEMYPGDDYAFDVFISTGDVDAAHIELYKETFNLDKHLVL